MADEKLELDFPSTDNFPSFDEVDSDEGQAQLPEDSFSEEQAAAAKDESGCCVR